MAYAPQIMTAIANELALGIAKKAEADADNKAQVGSGFLYNII